MPKIIPDYTQEGFVKISKEAFFATVGRLNVAPYPVGNYDKILGYKSEWKTPLGNIYGIRIGGTCFSEPVYLVPEDFYDKNHDVISKADMLD